MKIEELSKFGLSESVISKLKELEFDTLTDAQEKAVKSGLFDKVSLLIDAPTNTGKTFIGELAVLNASRQKDHTRSFYVVPLKALAEQAFDDFDEKYKKWGLKIAISTSDHYKYDDFLMDFDVIISTYEKLNVLLVRNPKIANEIGLVVIDEIQHIADRHRGTRLEMLLTKLKIHAKNLQIIGLSATVSNAQELANWLKSHLVQVEKRDVELREGILYTGTEPVKFRGLALNRGDFIYREFNSRKIDVEPGLNLDYVSSITKRSETEQCLVFVNTQRKAERMAQKIARDLPEKTEMYNIIEQIDTLVESIPSTRILKKALKKGVAFHHAGLLVDERRIIEDGFRKGLIRVVCSTPTLGAGVNTPAKNVIILFRKYFNGSPIFVRTYKNISGRAGRLRKAEEFGRSLLLAENEKELEFLWNNYVDAEPEKVVSQIPQRIGFDCSILGLISSKTCTSRGELVFFMEMTFFGFMVSEESPDNYKEILEKGVNHEVDELLKMGLMMENERIEITELGLRCAEELFSPLTVLFLFGVIKENESKIQKIDDYEELVPALIHLCCCTNDAGRLFEPTSKAEIQELEATWMVDRDLYLFEPTDRELFLRSLRTTRMLLRWIEGVTYFDLSAYAPAGVVKRIAGTLQWVLRGLARLTERPLFEFRDDFIDFLCDLSERVYFGVPKDAITVTGLRIKGVHRRRAISLASSGYGTIDSLLEAGIDDLKNVNDIDDVLARRIKEKVEQFIEDNILRQKARQIRLASGLGKDRDLILGLYETHGDDFARFIVRILKEEFGIDATFIGEDREHEPDILITLPKGNIVVESKRKEKGKVTTLESEEILGKGAKYTPIAQVTIGYPDFVGVAKGNAVNTGVTLITATTIGDVLIQFWKGEISREHILHLLQLGKCVYGIESALSEIKIAY